MKIDRAYLLDQEIDKMSVEEIKEHFMDYIAPKMRTYLQKGVIRQSTYERAWQRFAAGGEKEEKVRREYKKLLVKCHGEWKVKFGKKFKHLDK